MLYLTLRHTPNPLCFSTISRYSGLLTIIGASVVKFPSYCYGMAGSVLATIGCDTYYTYHASSIGCNAIFIWWISPQKTYIDTYTMDWCVEEIHSKEHVHTQRNMCMQMELTTTLD